ncbi:hypothetical protein L5G32_08985 [Gordonia sp. HY002]|uniref:hypothetical protein n=1 Tax=Gordonia zhenghanii TaxID=2911516 RepID=UPI001EEFE99F|nr:hypothetical protein [Gordonia zhenghanii]MCF8570398.1 hypothetical protein [Gordonia zhenghanii]MCF8604628.1 hypothetical protein [Gordonia zhenghanii]
MTTFLRGGASTIPVAIVIVVLAVGALAHLLASVTTLVLIGVVIGVTRARPLASMERWAWAAVLFVALVLLVWARRGAHPGFETAAVMIALLAICGVFYRWFRIGSSERQPQK